MNELKFFWFFFFFLCSTLLLACLVADILIIFSLIFWSRELYFFLCSSLAFFSACRYSFVTISILGIYTYILILRGSHSLDRLSIIIQFIMKLLFIMKGLDEDFVLASRRSEEFIHLKVIFMSSLAVHTCSFILFERFRIFLLLLLLSLDISTTSLPLFAMHFLFLIRDEEELEEEYHVQQQRNGTLLRTRGNLFDVCVCVCFTDAVFLSLSLSFGTQKKELFFWKRTNLIDFLESTRFNVPSRRDKLSFIANEAKCNLSTTFLFFFLFSSYFYVYMNIVEKWKKFMAQRRRNSAAKTKTSEEWVTDNYFQTHSTTQQRDNFHHFLSHTPARLLNTHSSNGGWRCLVGN